MSTSGSCRSQDASHSMHRDEFAAFMGEIERFLGCRMTVGAYPEEARKEEHGAIAG